MDKQKKKSVLLIIIAGVLVIFFTTGSLIALDGIFFSKKYPIKFDDWGNTPYAALRYGKYLGIYQGLYEDYKITFRSYSIKGVDKNDLIYTYQSSGFPWTHSSGHILIHKKSKINPIKDWSVSKIIISNIPVEKNNKDIYTNLGQINEYNIIDSLVNAINGEYEKDISDYKIVDIVLLFVFKECPSLALMGSIIKNDDKIYLCIEDKYYDIDTILLQYLNKFV